MEGAPKGYAMRSLATLALIIAFAFTSGCRRGSDGAEEVPRDDLGKALFEHTAKVAPRYVSVSGLSCSNCHAHEGRPDRALALGAVDKRYPAYSHRDGRMITLKDRIRGCFQRSLNGTGPADDAPEMEALARYIGGLPGGGVSNIVPQKERVPIAQLSIERGQMLYQQKCTACHMPDGRGTGPFPALWGRQSFNDGAGMGRIYTLAAFIHNAMPLGNGGTISLRDAQDIARFIDAQERPRFDRKTNDYPRSSLPPDAIYYSPRKPVSGATADGDGI